MELILLKVQKIKPSSYKEESCKVCPPPHERCDIRLELTGSGFLSGALFISSWEPCAILLNHHKANGIGFPAGSLWNCRCVP